MLSTVYNRRGLTIMEMLVVIAIIGAMMGLGIGLVQISFDLDLEKASRELSSAMRYIASESARTGDIYRLVIDLDEEKYWVESAPNAPETLTLLADEQAPGEERRDEKVDEEGESPEGEEAALAPPEGFSPAEDILIKAKRLAPVFAKDLFVAHLGEKQEEGKASIYFFPNGSTEYAIVNLSDEEETVFYSIEINPLSGKTKIRNEYYENPY